jgi:hypothetical protein
MLAAPIPDDVTSYGFGDFDALQAGCHKQLVGLGARYGAVTVNVGELHASLDAAALNATDRVLALVGVP